MGLRKGEGGTLHNQPKQRIASAPKFKRTVPLPLPVNQCHLQTWPSRSTKSGSLASLALRLHNSQCSRNNTSISAMANTDQHAIPSHKHPRSDYAPIGLVTVTKKKDPPAYVTIPASVVAKNSVFNSKRPVGSRAMAVGGYF